MDTTLLLSSGGGRSGEWIHCTSLRETRVGPPRGEGKGTHHSKMCTSQWTLMSMSSKDPLSPPR
jgi:hypothetical protein